MKELKTAEGKRKTFYYGYIIVALSFIAMAASMGIRGSFGTYVSGWEESFSVNRAWVSSISFVSLFVYGVSVIFAGRFSDKIGPRKVLAYSMALMGSCMLGSYFATSIWQVMLLYGLIGSIGFGLASNITVSVAIVRWFKEKKGLMLSIVVVGMAAGPMIFGPMNLYLIETIGWRHMFALYGGIYIILFLPLFALLFRDIPTEGKLAAKEVEKEISATAEKKAELSIFSIFRYPITWLIILTYIICGFTDVGLIATHFVPIGEHRNFSAPVLGNALILFGITNIVGTLIIGQLTEKFSPTKLLTCIFMIRALAIVLLLYVNQPMLLFVFALLYGFTDIASIVPFTLLCNSIFGEKNMGSAFGMISFFHQVGAALGSLIPGVLFSIAGNYQSTLILSTVILIIGAILLIKMKPQKHVIAL